MKCGVVALAASVMAATLVTSNGAAQPVQVDERYVIRTDPHHIPIDRNPLVDLRHELRGLPEEREQINRWITECDNGGNGDSSVFDICNQLIQTQWFAGDAEGHLRVRRAQAWLDMGDETRALRELDYGLQLYTHTELGPGVPIPEGPNNLPRHPGTETIQPRAQGFCERAIIRWRSGDLDAARADFETARRHWPDEPCAAEGLTSLARGIPAPALVAGTRIQERSRQGAIQSCMTERMAAARAWFGPRADEAQAARLDVALEPLGVFNADLETLARNRAMFTENLSGDSRAQASEAYLVCLQTTRIRQIQPGFDFSRQVELDGSAIETVDADDGAPATPQDDIFAALPRRDAAAAAGLLGESLDPQARQARRLRVAEDTRRRQANIQRRAENRAAFWSALGEVLLVGAQTYVAVETARLEMELNQALAASATSNALAAPSSSHQTAAAISNLSQGYAETLPPTGGQGYAYVEGGAGDGAEPMGQRIYDTVAQYAASQGQYPSPFSGSLSPNQSYLDPRTGRSCVTESGRSNRDVRPYIEYRLVLTNTCDITFHIAAERRPPGRANPSYNRSAPAVIYRTRDRGPTQHVYTCIQYIQDPDHPISSCHGGFSGWRIVSASSS